MEQEAEATVAAIWRCLLIAFVVVMPALVLGLIYVVAQT